MWAHRTGKGTCFTQKYKIKYLLYYEELPNINEAIEREKQIKNWRREWKFNLIKKANPDLNDLWNQIK
ncbi:GIY-YIG nuclease family protein [Aliifodinibius sp. S!AR15-10]|uniref:GIY-YIG nuclease family protein n=1 Tax=Aliifodinibius sp. S!AR15-10 TaxID=2950437 RepID=UPI0038F6C711